MSPLLFAAWVLASPAPALPPEWKADLDGDGKVETATAHVRGKTIRLEIADASGKRLASADAPAPDGATDASIRLQGGSLGSPGALLEVAGDGSGHECRSVWRFHDKALARLPLRRGTASQADCSASEGWTTKWEKPAENAPAVYVRERTRETPGGRHHEKEVFAFTGFALELDPSRGAAEIAGVEIPAWNDAILYTKPALDTLVSRFDLSPFRAAPRLRIQADRSSGLFAFHLSDRQGTLDLPVTANAAAAEPNERDLTLGTDKGPLTIRAAVRGGIVWEVRMTGLSARWDALYVPASRFTGGAFEIYARAEDEIATDYLAGLWASEKGEQLALNLVPGVLGALEMRRASVDVLLDPVPSGTDVLLVPRDGSPPAWGLALRGGNGLARLPVRCGGRDAGVWRCETIGPAQPFHRVGGRMNAR